MTNRFNNYKVLLVKKSVNVFSDLEIKLIPLQRTVQLAIAANECKTE